MLKAHAGSHGFTSDGSTGRHGSFSTDQERQSASPDSGSTTTNTTTNTATTASRYLRAPRGHRNDSATPSPVNETVYPSHESLYPSPESAAALSRGNGRYREASVLSSFGGSSSIGVRSPLSMESPEPDSNARAGSDSNRCSHEPSRKRSGDNASAEFLNDVKKSRLEPVFDMNMVSRLVDIYDSYSTEQGTSGSLDTAPIPDIPIKTAGYDEELSAFMMQGPDPWTHESLVSADEFLSALSIVAYQDVDSGTPVSGAVFDGWSSHPNPSSNSHSPHGGALYRSLMPPLGYTPSGDEAMVADKLPDRHGAYRSEIHVGGLRSPRGEENTSPDAEGKLQNFEKAKSTLLRLRAMVKRLLLQHEKGLHCRNSPDARSAIPTEEPSSGKRAGRHVPSPLQLPGETERELLLQFGQAMLMGHGRSASSSPAHTPTGFGDASPREQAAGHSIYPRILA